MGEAGKDKVGEILAEENRGIYKFNQMGVDQEMEIEEGSGVRIEFSKRKGSNIEGVVILIGKEEKRYLEGEDLVGELLEEKVEGDKVYSIFVKRGGKEESKGSIKIKVKREEKVELKSLIVTTLDGVEIELDRAKEWNRGLGYISLVKEQEGYTLLSIEAILDGEYIDRNNGNVIFKPGRYMVKYKTAEGEEQEYKLLVENDPLLSIGVDGEKVGLDRIEERIFGKVGMAEIVKGTEVQMAFMKEEGSIIEKVVVKEVGKDKVGEILAEENRGIYKFNQEGERSIEIFVKLKE